VPTPLSGVMRDQPPVPARSMARVASWTNPLAEDNGSLRAHRIHGAPICHFFPDHTVSAIAVPGRDAAPGRSAVDVRRLPPAKPGRHLSMASRGAERRRRPSSEHGSRPVVRGAIPSGARHGQSDRLRHFDSVNARRQDSARVASALAGRIEPARIDAPQARVSRDPCRR
jgi:hypothetical protein